MIHSIPLFVPAEIACGLDDFSTLCTLVKDFGLAEALSGGTWTVFAPPNSAFEAIADAVATLDEATIVDVLLFHAVPDVAVKSSDLKCGGLVEMANGKDSRTICRHSLGEVRTQLTLECPD
jgi:uncharacterized surface protein with fasciclin (FAS1) repeats